LKTKTLNDDYAEIKPYQSCELTWVCMSMMTTYDEYLVGKNDEKMCRHSMRYVLIFASSSFCDLWNSLVVIKKVYLDKFNP